MDDEGRNQGPGRITGLLREAAGGNREAFDQLLPLVYDQLRILARGKLRLERPGHTLNTNALVHEAYFKLVGQTRIEWQNRGQFFGVASEAMRRILIDYAKQRRAAKRGGGQIHMSLDEVGDVPDVNPFSDREAEELLALNDALERLAEFNPRGAKMVEYRFFGGMSTEEIVELTGWSERTVRRIWTTAKAWLRSELERDMAGGSTLLNLRPGGAS
jgi:RNA polymerase sigma factor (TIGR02999 family)